MILSCDVGTHVVAPRRFFEHQRAVSDLACVELLAPAVIIDITPRVRFLRDDNNNNNDAGRGDGEDAAADQSAAVTVDDITAWEQRNGRIPDGALVCMRSGWSRYFSEAPDKYLNKHPATGRMRFPHFSLEAATFLVRHRRFVGLGVDTLSPDAGDSDEFPVHGVVLGAGKYHVENMVLDGLPEAGFSFVTAPLRIEGAYEAPCRCVALSFVLHAGESANDE